MPGGAGNPYDIARDVTTGKNTAGLWALGLGLAAIVFSAMGPTVWLSIVAAVAAIVWGGVGIARSSKLALPKAAAIAGLVLGVVVLVGLMVIWGPPFY